MKLNKGVYLVLAFCATSIAHGFSQKTRSFSGELVYHIRNVDKGQAMFTDGKDEEEKMIIYAKDSLLKVVNFNSASGAQECLKHLSRNKSILLLEIGEQGYAVRIKEEESNEESSYTFKKKCGFSKRYQGLKCKKILMKHPSLSNDLICFYTKKIPAKYGNVFAQLPGLPVLYYLISPKGLLRFELESYKIYDPPLTLFMIPEGYEVVSMEEFLDILGDSEE